MPSSSNESPSQSSGPWQAPTVEQLQVALPQYEILELLGCGGMGAVYKARQKSLKRIVAIKILPLGLADDEFRFVERFRQEAETMAAMNHPAIVAVHDFGETPDGLLYFVMEFVDGTDVQKMIHSSGRLPVDHALSITAHVCDALAYAHARGVVHRDIKPANILINSEGHVKVADFGLAKMHDPSQTSGLTRSNVAMGTPDYVAPEVLLPGVVADHRADLYAVGVMLYQMLTGEVPRGMFKLPSQKGIGSDPRFDEIICRAMEQDREERYQSAIEVRGALDAILTAPLGEEPSASLVPAPRPVPSSPVAPASGKMKWLAAAAVTAVLAIAGMMLTGGKDAPLSSEAEFKAQVAAASPEKQVALVAARIEALNNVPVQLEPEIVSGRVDKLVVKRLSDLPVPDLSPVAALPGLSTLSIETPGLRDISWLSGTTVVTFNVNVSNAIADLEVLRGTQLRHLTISGGPPRNYSVLAGMPLKSLRLYGSPLRDLSFLKGMPLDTLGIEKTGVTDLSPLLGLPLRDLLADIVPERDAPILRAIPTLTKINGKAAAEFWRGLTSPKVLPGGTIDWIHALPGQASPWAPDWRLAEGVLKPSAQLKRQFGLMHDGSVRLRVRLAPDYAAADGSQLQLTIRSGSLAGQPGRTGHMQFQTHVPNRTASLHFQDKTTPGLPVEPLHEGRPARISELGWREVEWEFRAVGGEYTAWADGQLVAKVQDARIPSGYCLLEVRPGIEITRLETTGLTPVKSGGDPAPASPPLPPRITHWQDVTADVREKARAYPQLVVGPDAIQHSGQGSSPVILLTDQAARRFAVRLTHAGDGQVNRRTASSGISYVLCQRTKTIFQSHGKDAAAPVRLTAEAPHPPGYIHGQPHELLVTFDGPVIRAWLDGRFAGEAQDHERPEGKPEISISKWGEVLKVELGELEGS